MQASLSEKNLVVGDWVSCDIQNGEGELTKRTGKIIEMDFLDCASYKGYCYKVGFGDFTCLLPRYRIDLT